MRSIQKNWLRTPIYQRSNIALVLLIAILSFVICVAVFRKKPATNTAYLPELDTFSRVLSNGSEDQIIAYSKTLVDEQNLALPVRIERLDQRVSMANRLVELTEDVSVANFAKHMHLESKLQLVRVFAQNKLPDNDQHAKQTLEFGECIVKQ